MAAAPDPEAKVDRRVKNFSSVDMFGKAPNLCLRVGNMGVVPTLEAKGGMTVQTALTEKQVENKWKMGGE